MSEKKPPLRDPLRFYGKLVLILFAVTAVAALLMALVNGLTQDRIAALAEARRQEAMSAVMPGENVIFSQVPFDPETVLDMQAAYQGGLLRGYCVQLTADGFGGPITLMVGVDGGGKVTGVTLLDHHETAGVGTRVDDDAYLGRFRGKAAGSGVDALSGATVTSRAVARGVDAALEAVKQFEREGGMNVEEGEV